MTMIARDDQAGVDSELATDAGGQAMKLTLCKRDDTTYYTLEGGADEARVHMRAFGTNEPDFFYGLLQQIVNAGSKGKYPDETGVKFMLAFIRSREPRDEFEATMLSQMAATQLAIMRFTNRLAHAETLQAQDSAERTLNKLIRTFNMQVETFQLYRFANERKALVQHLPVRNGGQTIMGAAREEEKRAELTPLLTNTRQSPTPIIDERHVDR